MCDDFMDGWDDLDNTFFDPDNDLEEDLADEYCSPETDEICEEPVDSFGDQGKEEQHFDILDAMIVGSMIAGNANEEMEDEKRKRKGKN